MAREGGKGIRSEVVGSLLRPQYLKEATQRFDAGAISAAELAAAQERAILEAIALQEDVGIDVITDGEMRRRSWTDPLTKSLTGYGDTASVRADWGLAAAGGVPRSDPRTEETPSPGPRGPGRAVTDRLARGATNLPLLEYDFLRSHTAKNIKVTLPSLAHASVLWAPGVSDRCYPDRAEYQADVRRLVTELVAECIAHGATYIQLDSPRYTHLVSAAGLENFRRLGIDPETWLTEMIAEENALIDQFPQVTWGLHLCRGNGPHGRWAVVGGYDAIADQLFNDIHVDRLLLEYDTPRAGTFAPLRFVPPGKTAVLGLISTKGREIERPELLEQRVDEAARYLSLDQLALSPQCGFASAFEGNVSEEAQRAKLATLGRVAREIWG